MKEVDDRLVLGVRPSGVVMSVIGAEEVSGDEKEIHAVESVVPDRHVLEFSRVALEGEKVFPGEVNVGEIVVKVVNVPNAQQRVKNSQPFERHNSALKLFKCSA